MNVCTSGHMRNIVTLDTRTQHLYTRETPTHTWTVMQHGHSCNIDTHTRVWRDMLKNRRWKEREREEGW